jgi:hypothetical protein
LRQDQTTDTVDIDYSASKVSMLPLSVDHGGLSRRNPINDPLVASSEKATVDSGMMGRHF